MIKILSISAILIFSSSCEGSYHAIGTVYDPSQGINVPVESVRVFIYVGKNWIRDSTSTSSNGGFESMGLTAPGRRKYYFVFSKSGYKTDTVKLQGSRGRSYFTVDHMMSKLREP